MPPPSAKQIPPATKPPAVHKIVHEHPKAMSLARFVMSLFIGGTEFCSSYLRSSFCKQSADSNAFSEVQVQQEVRMLGIFGSLVFAIAICTVGTAKCTENEARKRFGNQQ